MIREFFDWLLYKFGYISEAEVILRSLPKEKQKRVKQLRRSLSDLRSVTNLNEYFELSTELTGLLKEGAKNNKTLSRKKGGISLIPTSDIYGYKPGMSRNSQPIPK